MTQGRPNNSVEMKGVETQVRKARQLVQSELKVEAIVASIYEIEKFYPKIKIVRRPDAPRRAAEDGFGNFAENASLT